MASEESSGNIFADMGASEPEEALAKAQVARAICLLVEKDGLTQNQIGRTLGIDQPAVSRLLRGRLAEFSLDRLLKLLLKFGHSVDITVGREKSRKAAVSVSIA